MNGSIGVALSRALDYNTPDSRIDYLKTTVSNFLHAGDPSMQVRKTEFFNHTFAPDLVLTWPKEGRERLVFLRTNPDPRWLASDLRAISDSHPIILTLDTWNQRRDERPRLELSEAAIEASALVTDPAAIEELTAFESPITSVLSNAVMRGGLGVVDGDSARAVAESAVIGFDGAASLEPEPIRAALSRAEAILNDEQAGRFSRLYQVVWEGHGGAVENFPSARNIVGPMTSRDLALVLSTLDTDDIRFWRRIGHSLTLDQLTALGELQGPLALGLLVEANADRLVARGVRVFGSADPATEQDPAHWSIERNCLVLRGIGWTAFFAPRSTDLPAYDSRRGIPVESLVSAIRDLGVRMTEVKVKQNSFAISIEAVGAADVVDSPDFGQLASRGGSIANSAAIAMTSGRNLIADFITGTATGHTNATFTIRELGPAAIKLLLQLGERETSDLTARMRRESNGEIVQPPLWE
ncbi:hypothetical protein ABZ671_30315 [Micromonospora sp. NPDC006766]|uniref:hypothetical protein n=1 Tax=Micromonospora sp. NPDC006766 TaxID=3154778 RepID=UPI003404215C